MNNWIDVQDLKQGDYVLINGEAVRINYTVKNSNGEYIVGYWTDKHTLWEKTFLPATSLQKVQDDKRK